MPNRMIKESIKTSKKINDLSDFEFRLWIHLIISADDYGRGYADPELVKNLTFPRRSRVTEKDIKSALASLAGKGCISLYGVDGESYFYFPNWANHQRIQTKKSKFPEPDESTVIHGESPSETKPNRNQIETEDENKKETRARVFVPPTVEEVREYVNEQGLHVNPDEFVNYFNTGNWVDSKGNKVKNWKQKIQTWENFGIKDRSGVQKAKSMNNFSTQGDVDYDALTQEAQDKFYAQFGGDA